MNIEILSIISSSIVGLGGIIASIISAKLSSDRAKEANAITKKALFQTTCIEEKRASNQKVIADICTALQISSPQTLEADYKSICEINNKLSEVIYNFDIKIQEIAYYSNLIYLEMPVESKPFYEAILNVCNRAIIIYKKIEEMTLSINRNMEKLNISLNDNIGPFVSQIIDGQQINEYRVLMDEQSKAHESLMVFARQYIDQIRNNLLTELEDSENQGVV